VILSAVAGLAFWASHRITEELVFARNLDRTQLLANQLSADLEQYRIPLGRLGLSMPTTESSELSPSPDQLSAILWSQWPVGSLSIFDAGVVALDQRGRIIAAATYMPPAALEHLAWPALMADAIPAEAWGFSNLLPNGSGEFDVLGLSFGVQGDVGVPVEGLNTLVGLFRAERGATRTSEFYRNIWNLYIGRRETAYLVDGNGYLLFHPDTFLIGDYVGHLDAVDRALAGATGAMRTADLAGDEVVAGYAPVPRTDWALVTEESWDDIVRTSRSYVRSMVLLLALGVIVPAGFILLGAGRITRPLIRMTRAAQDVAAGYFNQTIEVDTGDELETLAAQFNTMAQELAASYAHLEQRVADRTQELATLNAITSVVSRSLALDEVMQAALEKTLEALELEAGAAFRLTEDASHEDASHEDASYRDGSSEEILHLIAHAGLSQTFVDRIAAVPRRESIARDIVVAAGFEAQPVVRSIDDYPNGGIKRALQMEGFQTVICVPLVVKEMLLGVLNLAVRGTRAVTPEERSLLAAIGRQAGVAVENARLYEQAELTAAAEERNRLARELHDAVSQTLFTASLVAQVIPELWQRDPEEGRRQLAALQRLTRGAMAEMRTLLLELRPTALVEADLDSLIDQLARAAVARLEVALELDLAPAPQLPVDVKIALYRIIQEALNNVVKHADPSQIIVLSRTLTDGGVIVGVQDDGRGFHVEDVPLDHFGLSNMRERAEAIGAQLNITSAPGAGTHVEVAWRPEEV
jgi:nitrate/nitrite-specific signal transduction histidine kinase